jgi:predicted DNA-binding ribbon-helix-helix protein
MVKSAVVRMKKIKSTRKDKGAKIESAAAVRASISFPPDLYKTLEDIAREKKVSLAWVVREAAEKYVTDRWPLFGKADWGVQT